MIHGCRKHDDDLLEHFWVITPSINSPRFEARTRNYHKFMERMREAHVKVLTVECAFGQRPFEVTQEDNPHHLQFRSHDELWLKENLILKGIEYIRQIDPHADKVAWIDGDCFPISVTPRKWMEETWHSLQHYEIVQMWDYLINFGPDGQPITAPQMSFMKTYAVSGFEVPKGMVKIGHVNPLVGHSGLTHLGRPGLAWAANLSALDRVSLPERCILGSGDWHFARALIHAMDPKSTEVKLSAYGEYLLHFQELADRWIRRDVGFVPVTLGHWWHGDKVDRRYGDRTKILILNQYHPLKDIKYDTQGTLVLETYEERQIRMRDLIRDYFQSRNEDSVPLR